MFRERGWEGWGGGELCFLSEEGERTVALFVREKKKKSSIIRECMIKLCDTGTASEKMETSHFRQQCPTSSVHHFQLCIIVVAKMSH